jgi:PAS domain S-box-containing protein
MDGPFEDPIEEITRLRRSISDLTSILSLPALWIGGEASKVVNTLLDALMGMLHLDYIGVRLNTSMDETPSEMVRSAPSLNMRGKPLGIDELLAVSLQHDANNSPPVVKHRIGDSDISVVSLLIGLQGDIGTLVAGSKRANFPEQTEMLILSVAANQAAIGLREARLLGEQRSLAADLDRRVQQRTNELAKSNEELELQVNLLQQVQENLRRAEEKTRLIVDTALDAVVTMGADGIISSWNEQAAVIFGWSQAEAVGQRMSELVIPEESRAAHERGLRHYLTSGDGPILRRRIEITAVRRSGVHFPVELQVMPLKLGQEWFFSAFIRDITESKLAQQLLRQSEFNLRQMTEAIPEMLWSATPDGLVDYCNMRVLNYSGLSPEEIMGEGWKQFFHPDDADRAAKIWASCLATGEPYRVEVRASHAADLTYRWCITSALPLLDEDGRIRKWFGTVVDMHDWKQSQEELRKTQAELAHVSRVMTMGQFTASIAHEVNQPLSGILMNAGTCLRMLDSDPPNIVGARETARRTIRDGNRASSVITRLRDLFKKNAASEEPVDLNDATREVIALSLSELQSNQIVVQQDLTENLPAVKGDRIQIQQVILNLLRNASDAMLDVDDRPRHLLIRTEEDDSNNVQLTVRDTGVGFASNTANRLFESFYTTKSEGMGIGLSISRSIIEAHHGRLWASANDGPGSTFTFVIPQDHVESVM